MARTDFIHTLAFRGASLFLLMLLIIGAGFYWWLTGAGVGNELAEEETRWFQETSEPELDALAVEMSGLLQTPDRLARRTVEYGRSVERFGVEIILFDADGYQIHSSQPDSLATAVPEVDARLLQEMSDGTWDFATYPLPEASVDAYENRIFEVDRLQRPTAGAEEIAGYVVATYEPIPLTSEDIAEAERIFGTGGVFLVLAFSGLSGLVIMLWTTRRIQILDSGVRTFAAGDLKTRLPETSRDEVGTLSRHFNTMAGNLENTMEKLREKEQFQRNLIANISHDLRTPLSSMQGYIETLTMQAEELNVEERRRYLEIIASNLTHLDKLIDHMLVLSRFDSGQVAFRMEDFPLVELADSVLLRCEKVAEEAGVTLDLEVSCEDTLVQADPLQIAQVLQNLVENGIKFNRQGGRVVIHLDRNTERIEVAVADTGMGIAPEDLPHIFKRFFTADRSRTRNSDNPTLNAVREHLGQSSGLGLAIASKIVAGHNSMLQVDSRVNEGTRFRFSLQAAQHPMEEHSGEAES